MARLHDLPVELILELDKWLSTKDLVAFCCTSSGVHRVFKQIWHRSIDWEWGEQGYCPRIDLLVRTILERPELAASIQNLRLDGPSRLSMWPGTRESLSETDEIGTMVAAATAL